MLHFDVERMVQEAKNSASEDNLRRETVQACNEVDQAIYQAEKSIQDLGEKVFAPDRVKIEAQINKLKQAMSIDDTGSICAQIAELQQSVMVISQSMHSSSTETELGNDDHTEPQHDNVNEGEYREI